MSNCLEMKKQLNLDILNEWLKTGTMMLVARFLEIQQKGGDFADKKWVEESLFTLLGFTTYHIITKQFFPLIHPNHIIKNVINTWLRAGTMMVVSRLLAKKSVTDENWLRSSMYTLLGFTAYDVFTHKFVPKQLEGGYKATAQDAMAFGTMFVVSRMLEGQPLDDENWIKSSLYTIVGFAAYDLVGQYLFSGLLNRFKSDDMDMSEEEEVIDIASQEEAAIASQEEAAMQAAMEEAYMAQEQEVALEEVPVQEGENEEAQAEEESKCVEGFGGQSGSYASFDF